MSYVIGHIDILKSNTDGHVDILVRGRNGNNDRDTIIDLLLDALDFSVIQRAWDRKSARLVNVKMPPPDDEYLTQHGPADCGAP